MTITYRIEYSDSRPSRECATRADAHDVLRAQHPDLYLYDDGARELAWADEESADNDSGGRAVAEVVAVGLPDLTLDQIENERVDAGLYDASALNPPSGDDCAAILVTREGGSEYGAWRYADGVGDAPRFLLSDLLVST